MVILFEKTSCSVQWFWRNSHFRTLKEIKNFVPSTTRVDHHFYIWVKSTNSFAPTFDHFVFPLDFCGGEGKKESMLEERDGPRPPPPTTGPFHSPC